MSSSTIATLALIVSIGLAVWQFAQYVLEGARVRVRLHPALLDEYAIRRTKTSWQAMARAAKQDGGWYIEAAEIEVENISRYALTITDVSLDLGRSRWFRLGRRTVAPLPQKAPDASTDRSLRLEPFDRCAFVFDVWWALRSLQDDRRFPNSSPLQTPFCVRASVRVAGRRRRKRSPRRYRWRVRPGQLTFLDQPTEIGLAAWQSLSRFLDRDQENHLHHSAIRTALAIREHFPKEGPAPSKTQIEQLLLDNTLAQKEDRAPGYILVAFDVARDLAVHYDRPPVED